MKLFLGFVLLLLCALALRIGIVAAIGAAVLGVMAFCAFIALWAAFQCVVAFGRLGG